MAEHPSVAGTGRGDGAEPATPGLTRDLLIRTAAAGGCAGVVAGLFSAVTSRLAMSVLASLNTEDAGVESDDGFIMGRVTFGGTAQLTASTVQLTLVGAALYLLVRPFLIGTGAVRVVTSALGFGVPAAAIIIHPGVDFSLLEPFGLGIALFVAIPVAVVAVFSVLAEHSLRDGSWFMTAPRSQVTWLLASWVFAGVGLALLVPVFIVMLVAVSRRPSYDVWMDHGRPERAHGLPVEGRRLGQAVLVAIAGLGAWSLANDMSTILT